MQNNTTPLASSFRDPSGFMFTRDGVLYRQVNKVFKDEFDAFLRSGLYDKWTDKRYLVPHEIINENLTSGDDWYTTLRPDRIHFISYPWEWSFDMLKDAALLTLQLTKEAVAAGFILKDATPYNIQWHKGSLIFIDSLSFEQYDASTPWIAYRQFCENFLAPLLLMHYSKKPLQQLLLAYPEGVPLAIARALLPWKSRLSFHTYLHIHLHAKVAGRNSTTVSKRSFSHQKIKNLLTSLEILVSKLSLPAAASAWSAYYDEAAGRDDYLQRKKEIIARWIAEQQHIKTAADLGANDGEFAKILAAKGIEVIAADIDPYCINRLYREIKKNGETNIQPLVLDIANPSPAVGVNNTERDAFTSRMKTDLVLALALVHHLAIGKNIPFELTASFLARLSPRLIIEWVPKEDDKVQLMLSQKKDIYTHYTQENFEKAFSRYYSITSKEPVGTSGRVLYLLASHEG